MRIRKHAPWISEVMENRRFVSIPPNARKLLEREPCPLPPDPMCTLMEKLVNTCHLDEQEAELLGKLIRQAR